MFTGIVETLAKLEKIEKKQSNLNFTFSSSITNELKIDQSVSHNGVCLTVVSISGNQYVVTAIDETLNKTNLGELKAGDVVSIKETSKTRTSVTGPIKGKNPKFSWIDWNETQLQGTFITYPERESVPENIKEQLIVELYSK